MRTPLRPHVSAAQSVFPTSRRQGYALGGIREPVFWPQRKERTRKVTDTGPSDAVRAHRADYWTWIEANGVPPERDILLRLRDHWHEVNAAYFGGAMALPYVTLTEPSTPRILGQCCPVSSWGSRLEIRIRPSLMEGTYPHLQGPEQGRFLFAADVLTHEAIHQWQMEITGQREGSYHGHGPGFAEKANEIGTALGLPPVVARNRKGSDAPRAANWPHNVRPPEYYLGAYRPPGPVTTTGDSPCPHCAGTGRIREQAG